MTKCTKCHLFNSVVKKEIEVESQLIYGGVVRQPGVNSINNNAPLQKTDLTEYSRNEAIKVFLQ